MPEPSNERRATWPRLEQVFGVVLGLLLLGYMFLGRGFAHIGVGPIYIGDAVLLIGVVVAVLIVVRRRMLPRVTLTVALLIAFAVLGAIRTLPYLGVHGIDALRDGVLWGYAAFALIVYALADRRWVLRGLQAYGGILPLFAVWLPISWYLFALLGTEIDPDRPGLVVPLVFFKAGDMAVHMVGVVAFLVLVTAAAPSARTLVWRAAILVPLLWIAFASGTANRGALVTFVIGLLAVAVLTRHRRNWIPVGGAMVVLAVGLITQALFFSGSGTTGAVHAPVATSAIRSEAPTTAGPTEAPPPIVLASITRVDRSPGLLAADGDGEPIGVANSGFELGTPGAGAIFGWTPRSAHVDIAEGAARDGDQFAVLGNRGGRYDATLRSIRFAVDAGKDLRVSAWTKAVRGRPGLEIYVDWYDADGELISSKFVASQSTGGRIKWQRCEGAVPVPDGAVRAQLLFYESRGQAALGIDDVRVSSGQFIEEREPTEVAPTPRRPPTIDQLIDNIVSIFGSSEDTGLEGTKQFRLEWWGTIVEYTILGEHFWTGKGFGVNLADSDGFQSTADHSLRAPHNSHMTVLARMGVPGLVLWVSLQAAFAIGLLRATFAHRRSGDRHLAVLGAWTLAYWFAMMIDTSFDPYLEGPQGGIWFWSIFGVGLVVTRLAPRRSASG